MLLTVILIIFISSRIPAVSIDPLNQNVSPEENFTVSVYCEPDQPIKSFELKLSFDSSFLQVNSVTEGDIFDGYTTFFNSGTIDNNAGNVVDIYGLILGSGNVSNPGTLVNISLTTKSTIGSSLLNLYDVGVTNETEYVSITVNDGNVTVQSVNNDPIISNPNPSNGSGNVPISTASLSINIQDPDGDMFNYIISTRPNIGSSSGNESSNGSKSCNISDLDYSTTYTWYVSCIDTGSGNWTNKSYQFTTESNGGDGDGDGDGNGGGFPPPGSNTNDISEQNNPPETPVELSGPTFVEMGVEYTFMSSTYDINGEQIRYRFDWGDGNYSNWSDFMSSNISVSMSHHWSAISNYSVRVMAQDENGSNSSWSPALSVTVSQAESGEIPPVVDINVSSNASVNQTIVFDAVDSFDPDGTIVSYMWDFGDGETGSGVSPEHTYKKPGRYNVTLVLTDNNGNTYSKTITVNVASVVVEEQSEEKRDLLLFHFGTVIIGFMVAMICVFAVFFIKRLFFPNLHMDILHNIRGIEESESKIEKTKISKNAYPKGAVSNKITDGIDFIRASVVKMGGYYDKMQENYIKSKYKDELSFKENMHSDDSHDFHVDEKIENILQERLGSVKLSVEDSVFPKVENIDPIVDNPILSNIEKKLPVEKDDMFDESIESIRRKVDEIWASREQEKMNFKVDL